MTAALLRVLLHKIDSTTFGNDIPTLPQWTGPPRTIVQVQTILFASLAVSLFSASLAMLGKQWLNQYASTDLRGTAIERSQNRQRKLDGIVAWYFDHVMELLPLLLQAALLLIGCALSRYLWEISVTVASVVIGVTSFHAISYISLAVAGAASESCPYQTPASHALRCLGRRVLFSTTSGSDGQTAALDSRCISWVLQTSLDKDVRLSAMKYLTTMVELANVDPTLVVDSFNAFISCVRVGISDHKVAAVRGLEELAMASALGLLHTLSHLLTMDSTSHVLDDLRRRYTKVFPADTDFHGHPFYHIMSAIHCLLVRSEGRRRSEWSGYQPSAQEYAMVSHSLASLAQSEYRRTQRVKVPRWILRFALHTLSLDPPPPPSILTDCLSIVMLDLGGDALNDRSVAHPSDEHYSHPESVCMRGRS